MAKRAAPDEEPFRPLIDKGVVSKALSSIKHPQRVEPLEIPSNIAPIHGPEASAIYVASSNDTSSANSVQKAPVRFEPAQEKSYDGEKRILLARTETRAIDRVVTKLADRFGAPIKFSHVMRALAKLLVHAESEVHSAEDGRWRSRLIAFLSTLRNRSF